MGRTQKANTALNRYGSVDEVAALVAFVAGPEAAYITGASLTVDGRDQRLDQRARSPAANLGNVILRDGKGRFRLCDECMVSLQYISSGGCPMVNVVKKHSISFELAQKMVDKAARRKRENLVSART